MCIRDSIQIGAFDECQRVVADIIDSECRANGYLRAQRCSTGQGADEGFVAGVERDVARGEGGAVPVSYTHLDVYKRQFSSLATVAVCNTVLDLSLIHI